MSENEPTFEVEKPLSKDHAELADLEKEAAESEDKAVQKRFQVEQSEKFGKYDEFIGPLNSGDHSHDSYHAQRPTEGIYRNGNNLHKATDGKDSGEFAKLEDYLAQTDTSNGKNAEYYDTVNGIGENANAEYAPPDYESMKTRELALALVHAEMVGDPATVEEIRGAVEHLLMEAATHPESEMTDEDYEAELQGFDNHVRLARAVLGQEAPEAPAATEQTAAENSPVEIPAGDEASAAAETDASGDEVSNETDSTTPEGEEAERLAFQPGTKVEFNGEQVTVLGAFDALNDTIGYEVTHADGTKSLRYANELTTIEEESEKDTAVEESGEKKSKMERLKNFWNKSKDFVVEKFTMAYMETKWMLQDSIINRGVDPLTMTGEEMEKKKERNRTIAFLGAGAVILGAIILNQTDAFGHFSAGSESVDIGSGTGTSAGGSEVPQPLSDHDQEVVDSMYPGGDGSSAEYPDDNGSGADAAFEEEQPPTPEVVQYDPITVGNGEGGYALFDSLGLDSTTWDTNAENLRSQFPQDFYRMEGGGIGLAHPGQLSQGAQDAINALRS